VKYPSGHTDQLDVAIRRAALTGIGQTCAEIGKMNAEENGCNFMELSAHSGARPSHAAWQGQLVSLDGSHVGETIDGLRVLSLSQIGYGTGAGFRGWNCRHDWYPYYVGASTPNYTQQALSQLDAKTISYKGKQYSEYEITQMQRKQERNIRALKRQTVVAQDIMDCAADAELKEAAKADYQAVAFKLKTAEQELKAFCKATNQDRDRFREQSIGFGRSQAQKAVWAKKNVASGLTSNRDDGIIKPYEIKLSRADRKRIINRGIAEERPIFAVDTDTNKFASYVRNVPPKDGFYDVALHGTPTSAKFFGETIDAYTLANILRNRKNYSKGMKIRLLSCDTGNTESTGNCFAQLIANEMGVEVEAPTQRIWVYEDGKFFVSSNGLFEDGEMKLFYPRR
jgi:hypothetical protein